MATDRLKLYNGALRQLGERRLGSLAENREPRRILDDVWDDGAVDACLEQGFWKFALRTIRLDYTPDVEPDFGYRHAFDKPADFVRTAAVCSDEFFNSPVTRYADEADFWFCDLDLLYIQHVSDDDRYGYNFAAWPETFTQYVELYFANEAAPRLLNNDNDEAKIAKKLQKALVDARSKDAMAGPAKFMPPGGWATSRMRGDLRRRDRAGSGLIG